MDQRNKIIKKYKSIGHFKRYKYRTINKYV